MLYDPTPMVKLIVGNLREPDMKAAARPQAPFSVNFNFLG
jgi:hypothetical protein